MISSCIAIQNISGISCYIFVVEGHLPVDEITLSHPVSRPGHQAIAIATVAKTATY